VKHLWILALALIAGSVPALAQQVPPYTYPLTIGTSSTSILIANPARKKLIFHPERYRQDRGLPSWPDARGRRLGILIVAVINGAGCITLLPYDPLEVNNGAAASSPPMSMGTAWVGIASASASALTIWEWE
jgi:hypothetical protein